LSQLVPRIINGDLRVRSDTASCRRGQRGEPAGQTLISCARGFRRPALVLDVLRLEIVATDGTSDSVTPQLFSTRAISPDEAPLPAEFDAHRHVVA
jgi:hypothetical protein